MPDLERISQTPGQRPALILVDVICGFTDPACPLGSACDSVVAACSSLVEHFRRRELPRFFSTIIYRRDEQAEVFRRRLPALNVLRPGSPWVAVDPRLQHRPEEPLIERLWPSCFFDTDLAEQLRAADCDSLVVAGLTTSGCVRATVLDGLQHDYPVFIPEEAVGDRNAEAHRSNLFDLHAKYADVLPLDQLLAQL